MLLQQEGVNPDRPNHAGQTPLLIAAQEGYEDVVKILLEQEEVNPSKADNDGQAPLMHVAKNSHRRMIDLLQPRGAVVHGTLSGPGSTSYKSPLFLPFFGSMLPIEAVLGYSSQRKEILCYELCYRTSPCLTWSFEDTSFCL